MPLSQGKYDHVLREEFDDYDDRKRCCRCSHKQPGTRTWNPEPKGTRIFSTMVITVLIIALLLGLYCIYELNLTGKAPVRKPQKATVSHDTEKLRQLREVREKCLYCLFEKKTKASIRYVSTRIRKCFFAPFYVWGSIKL